MAPHSSTLAWKIPWMEEPGRLKSMGLLGGGHDWVTSLSHIGEGNGNTLQCSCLENPRDGGAWWAAIYGVAQSRTWLKRLSNSSSSSSCTYWHFLTAIFYAGRGCMSQKENSGNSLLSFLESHIFSMSAFSLPLFVSYIMSGVLALLRFFKI